MSLLERVHELSSTKDEITYEINDLSTELSKMIQGLEQSIS